MTLVRTSTNKTYRNRTSTFCTLPLKGLYRRTGHYGGQGPQSQPERCHEGGAFGEGCQRAQTFDVGEPGKASATELRHHRPTRNPNNYAVAKAFASSRVTHEESPRCDSAESLRISDFDRRGPLDSYPVVKVAREATSSPARSFAGTGCRRAPPPVDAGNFLSGCPQRAFRSADDLR